MSNRNCLEALEDRRLFVALPPGETYLTAVRTVGQQKNFTVDLKAGQAITLAAADVGGGAFQPELVLIAPNGRTVQRSVGDNGSFIARVAPVTGTYRVRVRDVGANDTASLRITAAYGNTPITDSDDAFAAESGRRFAATIEPGDLDVWQIPATEGQFVSVVATENTIGSGINMGVFIMTPSGQGRLADADETSVDFTFNATESGTYHAIVYEQSLSTNGRYGISFGLAPGTPYSGDADTRPLDPLETRNGDLPGGDTDVFAIPVGRNDPFRVTVTGTGASGFQPELRLVNDRGQTVANGIFGGNRRSTLSHQPAYSGVYYLVLRNANAEAGSTFSIVYSRA